MITPGAKQDGIDNRKSRNDVPLLNQPSGQS